MAAVSARFDDLGADGAPRRLGIMGGTFDPIHIGHLAIAEQAREAMRLDAVIFIPTFIPVFKRDRAVTPAADRLEMCRLAIESNPFFDVSDIEIRRGGDTYTVDTLRQLLPLPLQALCQLLLQCLQTVSTQTVGFFLQGCFLNLHLHDLTGQFIQFCRHGIQLRLNQCTSLIYQVNSLIRQETV